MILERLITLSDTRPIVVTRGTRATCRDLVICCKILQENGSNVDDGWLNVCTSEGYV